MRRSIIATLILVAGLGAPAGAAAATGTITTIAGTATKGYNGDGIAATTEQLRQPVGVTALPDGSLVIGDSQNARVRKIDPAGVISTIAGNGVSGFGGDGLKATDASLDLPAGAVPAPGGAFIIPDSDNQRLRRVGPAGIITTVAGTGVAGYNGDEKQAGAASLFQPSGIVVGADGTITFADSRNDRVRRITPDGIIRTIAGTGVGGFSGDGGPATAAKLEDPTGIVVLADGGILIADLTNYRIRKVDPAGIITTVAGIGKAVTDPGDGLPATATQFKGPSGLAVAPDGTIIVSEVYGERVRRIDPSGTVTTLAGTGKAGFSGDGGPANVAQVNTPSGVAVLPDGSVAFADSFNHRVRKVDAGLGAPIAAPISAPISAPEPVSGSTPPTAAGTPPKPAAIPSSAVGLPGAKACVSRRTLTVTLAKLSGVTFRSAQVTLKGGGKTVRRTVTPTTAKGRTTLKISLKGLPRARFTVTIVVTAADGRTVTAKRSYKTCAAKKKR